MSLVEIRGRGSLCAFSEQKARENNSPVDGTLSFIVADDALNSGTRLHSLRAFLGVNNTVTEQPILLVVEPINGCVRRIVLQEFFKNSQ